MQQQEKLISFNVNFRVPISGGAYFATFDADTGCMIFCSNSTISGLFMHKDLRSFILFCRYNNFEFWG